MKSIKVKLENKTIEVKKLPIGKYIELLKQVEELPKHLSELENLSNDVILQKLPFLFSVALPDIIRILSVATDLPKEEIEEAGFDEVADLILAVIEVNNYQGVFEKIKKFKTRLNPQTQIKAL